MSEEPRAMGVSPFGPVPADWRVVPLGELTSLMTNGFVGTATTHYVVASGVTYIQGFNVVDGGFNLFGIKQVSQEFHNKHQKSRLCDGDLLTIQTGDVGLSTVVSPALAGSNCHALIISRFKSKSADSRYYMRLFNSDKGRQVLRSIETGSTMKHLNVGDMLRLLVPVPPLWEQIAIADCVESAADSISALKRLIAKKQAIKQGMMQQLLTGRTRLPGFTGPWVSAPFGDLAAPARERVLPRSVSQHTRLVELEHLDAGSGTLIGTSEAGDALSSKTVFRSGDVLFGKLRAYLRKFWIADGDGLCSTEIWALRARPGVAGGFIRYVVETDRFIEVASGGYGTHMPRSDWGVVRKLEIALPAMDEQLAISNVLHDADSEVRVLRDRLNKARAIKTGLMQQLLTGRTRLPMGASA